MDRIINGWYSEVNSFWPGQALSLEVDGPVLFHQKSQFQDVLIFKSKAFGNTLVLDDAIQITERDEMSYQEPLAHCTMFAHPNPKKVLVVGGGDGGILRELARHPSVEELHICEIDQVVIDAAKKYLPYSACGFEDPRVKVHVRDGFEFIKEHKNEFDVIITDSSDPAGPASQLFNEAYFTHVKEALTENGILGTQAECIWLHLELISSMKKFIGKIFPSVTYGITQTPTYPSGSLGFFLATKNGTPFPKAPVREITAEFQDQLKYYSKDMHTAMFVLPHFAAKALDL